MVELSLGLGHGRTSSYIPIKFKLTDGDADDSVAVDGVGVVEFASVSDAVTCVGVSVAAVLDLSLSVVVADVVVDELSPSVFWASARGTCVVSSCSSSPESSSESFTLNLTGSILGAVESSA